MNKQLDALLQQAEKAMKRQDWKVALDNLFPADKLSPNNFRVLYLLGQCLFENRYDNANLKNAGDFLSRASDLRPNHYECAKLGMKAHYIGNVITTKEADRLTLRAIKADPIKAAADRIYDRYLSADGRKKADLLQQQSSSALPWLLLLPAAGLLAALATTTNVQIQTTKQEAATAT